jgi:hypothetical protein
LLRIVFAIVVAGYGAAAVVVARNCWAASRERAQRAVDEASANCPSWEQFFYRHFATAVRLVWSVIHGLCWPVLLYLHVTGKKSS